MARAQARARQRLLPEFLDFSSNDEPEMPDMTGKPSTLPGMDPSIGPRAAA